MGDGQISGDKPRVVICGSIAIDRIMNFDGRYRDLIQPDKAHVLSISTLLDKLEDSRGGIGANVASALAQLGENPVLVGSVGHDAQDYVDDMSQLGVDTSHIHFSDLSTASFNVITDSEDNQVAGFYQGAMADSESVSFMPWAGQNILPVICGNNPPAMNRQVRECLDLGLKFIFDPGQQVSSQETNLEAGVNGAEVVFVNDYELGLLCKRLGATPEEIKKRVPVLITTLGRNGSIVEGNKVPEPVEIGVAKAEPVDPTGAGDAYRAGFLYGYVRQWDLKQCCQLGATVASFIVEKHGTQQTLDRQKIMERYKLNFNEGVDL